MERSQEPKSFFKPRPGKMLFCELDIIKLEIFTFRLLCQLLTTLRTFFGVMWKWRPVVLFNSECYVFMSMISVLSGLERKSICCQDFQSCWLLWIWFPLTQTAHHPWTTFPIMHCTHTFPSTITPITQLSPFTHQLWLPHHTCTSFTHSHKSSTQTLTQCEVLFSPG